MADRKTSPTGKPLYGPDREKMYYISRPFSGRGDRMYGDLVPMTRDQIAKEFGGYRQADDIIEMYDRGTFRGSGGHVLGVNPETGTFKNPEGEFHYDEIPMSSLGGGAGVNTLMGGTRPPSFAPPGLPMPDNGAMLRGGGGTDALMGGTQYAMQGVRTQPLTADLNAILATAAVAAGVDDIRIVSGGQPGKGSGLPRVGSTRHDHGNAADLQLIVDGRTLDFDDPNDRPIFETFISTAVGAGAPGVGAGKNYMGTDTIHVGFGSSLAWGANGKGKNAPQWLVDAHAAGVANPVAVDPNAVVAFEAGTAVRPDDPFGIAAYQRQQATPAQTAIADLMAPKGGSIVPEMSPIDYALGYAPPAAQETAQAPAAPAAPIDAATDKLARVMLAEARGEGVPGMTAVGQVVMNRIADESGRFPDTVNEVLNNEFAPPIDPSRVSPDELAKAHQLAAGVISGDITMPEVGGATYFANPAKSTRSGLAKIEQSGVPLATIGSHTFYGPAETATAALPAPPIDEALTGQSADQVLQGGPRPRPERPEAFGPFMPPEVFNETVRSPGDVLAAGPPMRPGRDAPGPMPSTVAMGAGVLPPLPQARPNELSPVRPPMPSATDMGMGMLPPIPQPRPTPPAPPMPNATAMGQGLLPPIPQMRPGGAPDASMVPNPPPRAMGIPDPTMRPAGGPQPFPAASMANLPALPGMAPGRGPDMRGMPLAPQPNPQLAAMGAAPPPLAPLPDLPFMPMSERAKHHSPAVLEQFPEMRESLGTPPVGNLNYPDPNAPFANRMAPGRGPDMHGLPPGMAPGRGPDMRGLPPAPLPPAPDFNIAGMPRMDFGMADAPVDARQQAFQVAGLPSFPGVPAYDPMSSIRAPEMPYRSGQWFTAAPPMPPAPPDPNAGRVAQGFDFAGPGMVMDLPGAYQNRQGAVTAGQGIEAVFGPTPAPAVPNIAIPFADVPKPAGFNDAFGASAAQAMPAAPRPPAPPSFDMGRFSDAFGAPTMAWPSSPAPLPSARGMTIMPASQARTIMAGETQPIAASVIAPPDPNGPMDIRTPYQQQLSTVAPPETAYRAPAVAPPRSTSQRKTPGPGLGIALRVLGGILGGPIGGMAGGLIGRGISGGGFGRPAGFSPYTGGPTINTGYGSYRSSGQAPYGMGGGMTTYQHGTAFNGSSPAMSYQTSDGRSYVYSSDPITGAPIGGFG